MFRLPPNVPVVIDMRRGTYAHSVGWPWREKIICGAFFAVLPEDMQSAIIAHEYAHIRLKHSRARIKAFLLLQWHRLADLAQGQELEADRYAAEQGYRRQMIQFLRNAKHAPGPWHPTHEARVDALKAFV